MQLKLKCKLKLKFRCQLAIGNFKNDYLFFCNPKDNQPISSKSSQTVFYTDTCIKTNEKSYCLEKSIRGGLCRKWSTTRRLGGICPTNVWCVNLMLFIGYILCLFWENRLLPSSGFVHYNQIMRQNYDKLYTKAIFSLKLIIICILLSKRLIINY